MALRLENATGEDDWEIEALLDTAFGSGRKGLSAYRLREDVEPVPGLSVIARDEFGSLAGTIRFWPVGIDSQHDAALLLGPVAVHPTRQGEGLGAMLIAEGLARARRQGWRLVILIGDFGYYARFGFVRCNGLQFPPPTDPARVLALELAGGGCRDVAGRVHKWTGDLPVG